MDLVDWMQLQKESLSLRISQQKSPKLKNKLNNNNKTVATTIEKKMKKVSKDYGATIKRATYVKWDIRRVMNRNKQTKILI